MTGTIKKLVRERNFGFIAVEGQAPGAKDLFFHSKDLQGVTYEQLNEGDKLTFEIAQSEKGPYAQNIVRATVQSQAA